MAHLGNEGTASPWAILGGLASAPRVQGEEL